LCAQRPAVGESRITTVAAAGAGTVSRQAKYGLNPILFLDNVAYPRIYWNNMAVFFPEAASTVSSALPYGSIAPKTF